MTQKPKLLTEQDIFNLAPMTTAERKEFFRERGLIAPEPVDPLLIEAREICAKYFEQQDLTQAALEYRSGKNDKEGDEGEHELPIALAALRRGMELAARPTLTREMVREAVSSGGYKCFTTPHGYADWLYAAILGRLS